MHSRVQSLLRSANKLFAGAEARQGGPELNQLLYGIRCPALQLLCQKQVHFLRCWLLQTQVVNQETMYAHTSFIAVNKFPLSFITHERC
jgi:hypothetical protein